MCPLSKKYPEFADKYLITHLFLPGRYQHFKQVTLRTEAINCVGEFWVFKMTFDRKVTLNDYVFQKTQDNTLCLDNYLRSKVYKEIFNQVGNSNFSVSEIRFIAKIDGVETRVTAKVYQ